MSGPNKQTCQWLSFTVKLNLTRFALNCFPVDLVFFSFLSVFVDFPFMIHLGVCNICYHLFFSIFIPLLWSFPLFSSIAIGSSSGMAPFCEPLGKKVELSPKNHFQTGCQTFKFQYLPISLHRHMILVIVNNIWNNEVMSGKKKQLYFAFQGKQNFVIDSSEIKLEIVYIRHGCPALNEFWPNYLYDCSVLSKTQVDEVWMIHYG